MPGGKGERVVAAAGEGEGEGIKVEAGGTEEVPLDELAVAIIEEVVV